MLKIFIKEINSFFDSLTAYIVIAVFLIMNGLILWVFPDTNVLDYGYADLSSFFLFGPYVLMFLIPSITMKMFSEENRSGTFELLATKPLSDNDIIGGKFLAGWCLAALALLPTLVYYLTISSYGNPAGNVDSSSVVGSYFGIILLSGVFTAIGLFSSSLTQNQVVSFILAVFMCFIIYVGLESLSELGSLNQVSLIVKQFGIRSHYDSISRGLIDSRDLVYFIGVMTIFLAANRTVLKARTW